MTGPVAGLVLVTSFLGSIAVWPEFYVTLISRLPKPMADFELNKFWRRGIDPRSTEAYVELRVGAIALFVFEILVWIFLFGK